MAILFDTSAIVALANRKDAAHHSVSAAVAELTEPLVAPITILAEVDYLVSRLVGESAARAVFTSLIAGEFIVEHLTAADLERAHTLMETYADTHLGFVDSSMIALAERLNITRILTLDRRHYGFVRPRHCANFDLLP